MVTKKTKNVGNATAAGVGVGATGATVITYAATWAEAKYGVPAGVTASVLGTGFAFLARWAAKLSPNE